MEISRNYESNSVHNPAMVDVQDLDALIGQLPEQELWQLLQDIIDREIGLKDDTIRHLDDRMQGFLFLQEFVANRSARIAFARSPEHMVYLRDAAGCRNVWMDDEEFTELVDQDDSTALACFARSEQMLPHHLMYIEHKLAAHPHRDDLLATSYDTRITLKKALEIQGDSPDLALMRLAKAALEGSADVHSVVESHMPGVLAHTSGDPRVLWAAYLNLRKLDPKSIREMLETVRMSTGRPISTSGQGGSFLH